MPLKPEFDTPELKARLTPEQYAIVANASTERAFSGEYDEAFENGTYECLVCGTTLFSSETKYNSGCGWPAFFAGTEGTIEETVDTSHGMKRVEVHCKTCGAHLGHVFPDGPADKGGMRYCINSGAIHFGK
jgi:peptide-methionine (R)-S-oxide reductase